MKTIIALPALRPGETGTVCRMDTAGSLRRRLRELGWLEGTQVRCLGRSPGGGIAAYELWGAVFALRDTDGVSIFVRKEGGG